MRVRMIFSTRYCGLVPWMLCASFTVRFAMAAPVFPQRSASLREAEATSASGPGPPSYLRANEARFAARASLRPLRPVRARGRGGGAPGRALARNSTRVPGRSSRCRRCRRRGEWTGGGSEELCWSPSVSLRGWDPAAQTAPYGRRGPTGRLSGAAAPGGLPAAGPCPPLRRLLWKLSLGELKGERPWGAEGAFSSALRRVSRGKILI